MKPPQVKVACPDQSRPRKIDEMAAMSDTRKVISDVFEAERSTLAKLNTEIWKNPETTNKETFAHSAITALLKDKGFEVEEKFIKETGFRAQFSSGCSDSGDADRGFNVCFICQYDAVADIGHAAGHNLQTTGSVAAALGIKICLEKKLLKGKVTVLGTPGDDSGMGSKIDMLSKGVFSDVDLCLMLTPLNNNILYPMYYNLVIVDVNYKGKASHASAYPWEGRSALDAAVSCYCNIALVRNQLKPNWSINGVISEGGIQPNVIPQNSQLKFWLRAPSDPDMVLVQQKCTACFVAAAKATGCEVHFEFEDCPNEKVNHNTTLGEIYKHHAQTMGLNFAEDPDIVNAHIGSTDMGNVSLQVPSIMPAFNIGTVAPIHTEAFCKAAGTDAAFEETLRAAKSLAYTAIDVCGCPSMLQRIQDVSSNPHASTAEIRERMQNWERQATVDVHN